MRNFILVHDHKYGNTTYALESENDIEDRSVGQWGLMGQKLSAIVKVLKIDFEPNMGESVVITELEAQETIKELRGSNHYARIICGMMQVVQKIKYFSITYKLK